MIKSKITARIIRMALMACFTLCIQHSFAQSVSTSIDKKAILIGEHIHYVLKFTFPANQYQIDFNVPDSIPHFDIIGKRKTDTTDAAGNYLFIQEILFTSFDSGKWSFPPLGVKLRNSSSPAVYTLTTDPVTIDVGYAPADSSGQLRDIKPVMDVSIIDYNWIYIAAAILTALIIGILLYRYFKGRKKAKPVFESNVSPYDEAMRSLKKLQTYVLNNEADVKEYHTELADVFRRYYSRKEQKNLMNKTTSDILLLMKEQNASSSSIFTLAEALRTADAVKFAKYVSPAHENQRTLEQVREVIEETEKSYKQPTTK